MAADVIDEVSHFLLTATTIVDGCANELKLKEFEAENKLEQYFGSKLCSVLDLYCDLFQRLSISNDEQFDKVFSDNFKNQDIRNCYEDFINFEDELSAFVVNVQNFVESDSTHQSASNNVDDAFTPEMSVTPLGSVREINLQNIISEHQYTHLEEYEKLDVQIVVVSFGSSEGASMWKRDTNCHHPIVLDQARKIYHSMGLRTSFSAVWGTSTMRYYAFQKQQGKDPIKPYENVDDDPLQLGGDCIIHKDGRVVLSYPQKDPTDRPSVDLIIKSLSDFSS